MPLPRPPRRSRRARAAVVVVLTTCVLAAAVPAGAAPAFIAPVDGPVIDGFRPPPGPYGPGNRGLEYGVAPGEEVRAAADGEVVFAGRIGPSAHVVVLHGDGLRTSYSFLADTAVRRGQRVGQGQVVGRSGSTLHFGARMGERYLDPALLLTEAPLEVHLVPVELRRPLGEAEERDLLRDLLVQAVRASWRTVAGSAEATGTAMAWAADAAVDTGAEAARFAERVAAVGWEVARQELASMWAQAVLLGFYVGQLPVSPLYVLHAAELRTRAERFREAQRRCTPPGHAPPGLPTGRRIAVLVGGYGSSSGEADVLDVDTGGLGYAAPDVVQFSYAGGRAPEVGGLGGVAVSGYRPDDSTGDLRVSAERLAELLDGIGAAHPGVPVDVIAHSQGGVVARLALAARPDGAGVANLVTLGSPHHGADVATANALVGTTTVGQLAQVGVDHLGGVDGRASAAAQLSEASGLVAELDAAPLPASTRTTSIAAAGDLTVGALHSSLDGATNVVVPLEGPGAHAELPGSATTRREIALALAGRGPTCRAVEGDLLLATAITTAADALGVSTGLGAMWADRALTGTKVPVRTPVGRPPLAGGGTSVAGRTGLR